MLFECANITAIRSDAIELQSVRGSACARCARGEGCGGGLIGKLAFRRDTVLLLDVDDATAYQVGQKVELSVDPARFLSVAATLYLLPLITLLGGALIGNALMTGDTGAILGASIGLAAGWFVLKRQLAPMLSRRLRPSVSPLRSGVGE